METVTTKEKIVNNSNSISEEEQKQLKDVQTKTQTLVIELGEIEMIKIQLEKRYNSAKEYLEKVEEEEKKFTEALFKKYGKINLNTETGEITK